MEIASGPAAVGKGGAAGRRSGAAGERRSLSAGPTRPRRPWSDRLTPMTSASFVYCERLARREAGNFYLAFRVLPGAQRRAMCALYAFMRVTDDISDGPGPTDEKRAHLADWRRRLDEALAGRFSHAL